MKTLCYYMHNNVRIKHHNKVHAVTFARMTFLVLFSLAQFSPLVFSGVLCHLAAVTLVVLRILTGFFQAEVANLEADAMYTVHR